ncbi:MAG: hypothetical protein KF814_17045 [Nitrospiraceae bacterium]|nr:hypothetical protein [Nitrospiraceae bacterium]
MLRFLGLLVLLTVSFVLGYSWGKRPTTDLEQTVKDLSRNVMDTTLGIERDLRRRQGLVDAKARVVQAKAELLNKNSGDAVKQLAEAVDSLEAASRGGKQVDPNVQIKELTGKVREIRLELSLGRKVPNGKLDEVQKELDVLLNK